MQKVLIEYASSVGNTARVAQDIAAACGGEIEEIRSFRDAQGPFHVMENVMRGAEHGLPDIKPPSWPLEQFDLVVVGVPVNEGQVEAHALQFLREYGERCRHLALFATGDGLHSAELFDSLSKLAGKQPVATLEVADEELEGETRRYKDEVSGFVNRLSSLH